MELESTIGPKFEFSFISLKDPFSELCSEIIVKNSSGEFSFILFLKSWSFQPTVNI